MILETPLDSPLFEASRTGAGAPMKSATLSNIQKSLEIIAKYVPTNPADAPAEFVRDLAHRWKERGGRVGGKPRHSDRYLDDLLRALGTPVRSLTPKLVGRTHLKPEDASVLVRTFLSHWDYVGDPNSGEIVGTSAGLYEPMLSDAEIERVSSYVAEQISAAGTEQASEADSGTAISRPPGQDTIDLISNEFKDATVLFSIGAGQIMLVPQPEMALILFRNLFTRLWAIDTADSQERLLIWTLDLGRQDFNDPESRLRFMNVQALVTRFKALKRFRENDTEARWNWLKSRTIIVLHDTRSVRPAVPRLPAFDPHHVLFSAIPPRWAGSPEFLALYGRERLHETAYTVFLKKPAGQRPEPASLPDKGSLSARRSYTLRYFGHALLDSNEQGGRELRGLRLSAPGWSYVEALGTIFVAASQTLGLRNALAELSIDGMEIDPSHAVEKLRHHGFLLLPLEEFLTF